MFSPSWFVWWCVTSLDFIPDWLLDLSLMVQIDVFKHILAHILLHIPYVTNTISLNCNMNATFSYYLYSLKRMHVFFKLLRIISIIY